MWLWTKPKKIETPILDEINARREDGHKHRFIFQGVVMRKDELWMNFECSYCVNPHLVEREFWKLVVTGQADLL